MTFELRVRVELESLDTLYSKSEYIIFVHVASDLVCNQAQYIMGWLQLVGSFKLHVSLAREPYKRDNVLQK